MSMDQLRGPLSPAYDPADVDLDDIEDDEDDEDEDDEDEYPSAAEVLAAYREQHFIDDEAAAKLLVEFLDEYDLIPEFQEFMTSKFGGHLP